jgi:hypothetical protein
MSITIHILAIVIILGILIYEDLRFRLIHLWIFPVLGLLFLSFQWNKLEWWHPLTNLSFLLLQFVLLTLWFSIKEKKYTLITRSYLGSGDIAFWITLALFFSPVNFILFFLCSLLGSLVLALTLSMNSGKKIPLAGFQAIFLCPVMLVILINKMSVRDDSFLLNILVV